MILYQFFHALGLAVKMLMNVIFCGREKSGTKPLTPTIKEVGFCTSFSRFEAGSQNADERHFLWT